MLLPAAHFQRAGSVLGGFLMRARVHAEEPRRVLVTSLFARLRTHLHALAPLSHRMAALASPLTPRSTQRPARVEAGASTEREGGAASDAAFAIVGHSTVGYALEFAHAILWMAGKGGRTGKSKRPLKPANRGARPCNHVGSRARRPRGARYRG